MNHGNVGAVNESVDGDVFAEVASSDQLSGLRLGLGDIARVDRAIGGRVAFERAHRHPHITGVATVAHVGEVDRYSLRVGDFGKVYRHHGAVYVRTADHCLAVGGCDCHRADANRIGEGDNHGVVAVGTAGPTLNARISSQRQIDIEVAGRAVRLVRDSADRLDGWRGQTSHHHRID